MVVHLLERDLRTTWWTHRSGSLEILRSGLESSGEEKIKQKKNEVVDENKKMILTSLSSVALLVLSVYG